MPQLGVFLCLSLITFLVILVHTFLDPYPYFLEVLVLINIRNYFLFLILITINLTIIRFITRKICLSRFLIGFLPVNFVDKLQAEPRFIFMLVSIFSKREILKSFLLSRFKHLIIALAIFWLMQLIFFLFTSCFLFKYMLLNLFCFSLAYNISSCYLNNTVFFSKGNFCFLFFNFINLFIARSIAFSVMFFFVEENSHPFIRQDVKNFKEFSLNSVYKACLKFLPTIRKPLFNFLFPLGEFIVKLPIVRNLNLNALLNSKVQSYDPGSHLAKHKYREPSVKNLKYYNFERPLRSHFSSGAKLNQKSSVLKELSLSLGRKAYNSSILEELYTFKMRKLYFADLKALLEENFKIFLLHLKQGKVPKNAKDILSNARKSLESGKGLTPEFLDMISSKNKQQYFNYPHYNENITVGMMRIQDVLTDESESAVNNYINSRADGASLQDPQQGPPQGPQQVLQQGPPQAPGQGLQLAPGQAFQQAPPQGAQQTLQYGAPQGPQQTLQYGAQQGGAPMNLQVFSYF